MTKRLLFLLLPLIGLFCQCKDEHPTPEGGKDYPSRETFTLIDNCMNYMNSDPQKAHVMLDSLRDAKLMTPQRCDYFHAIVTYSGEENLDSALVICNRLLDKGEFGDDAYLEEEICVLASDITSTSLRHVETLKYANRGIAICHGHESMHSDEATLMGRIGTAQQELGKTAEARETYANAYNLLKENNSFADFIALISLQRKQASLYNEAKDYDKVIDICQDILSQVERFDKDPSFIEQRPETMQKSSTATHEFADFYQCQMYGKIARAYRLKNNPDSVKAYIEKWSHTQASSSPTNKVSVLRELLFAGKKAEFNDARQAVEQLYQEDSLNTEYVEYLTLMAEEAAKSNDIKASNAYLKRAVAISDSIRQHNTVRELSEQLALHKVQEHQLAHQDAEHQLKRQHLTIILLSVLLGITLIAGIIIVTLMRRNRKELQIIEMTQQDLSESKEEIRELVQQLEETKAEKVVVNIKTLYERIESAMAEEKLYLNPDLDLPMLATAVNSSRSMISLCINNVTGKTVRQWIAEYRLAQFVKMMKENPDELIDVLVMRCGYKEQSTFRRQFKSVYGVTAGEYKKQLTSQLSMFNE